MRSWLTSLLTNQSCTICTIIRSAFKFKSLKRNRRFNLQTETTTDPQGNSIYRILSFLEIIVTLFSGHRHKSTSATRAQATTAAAERAPGPGSRWTGSWRGSGNDAASDWPMVIILTSDWFRNMSGSAGADTSAWHDDPGSPACVSVWSDNTPDVLPWVSWYLGEVSATLEGSTWGCFIGHKIQILPLSAALRWQLELTGWRTDCTFMLYSWWHIILSTCF